MPQADHALPEGPLHARAQPHSPIEREIERSERACAALAATRALARASSNDSQLEGTDADADIQAGGWVRTEYAALDQSVRAPQEGVPHAGAARNLVGGSFNPSTPGPATRPFVAATIPQAPIKTRSGAQARFMHEARQAPRDERPAAPAANRPEAPGRGAHYDKPAVIPMLVSPAVAPAARAAAAQPGGAVPPQRAVPGTMLKFVAAAGLGALAVLVAGGAAWKAGWLPHPRAADPVVVTAQMAAQAEAARVLSPAQPEIPVAPAAGPAPAPQRSDDELNAALAAAARAAAMPMASVHAAAPAVAPMAAPPVAGPKPVTKGAPSPTTPPATGSQRVAPAARDSVAAAIAKAQARADSFLSSGASLAPAVQAEAPGATAAVTTAP